MNGQAYLEGLERTLLGLEKRGPPALVVLEGAEPSIARDLGFLVLQRSHANVLSVATGLTEAVWALSTVDHAGGGKKTLRRRGGKGKGSGLLPFPLRVKGWRRTGNNNMTDGVGDDEDSNSIRASDLHRLLGEALVALLERENAIVACGLREQRPGRDGAVRSRSARPDLWTSPPRISKFSSTNGRKRVVRTGIHPAHTRVHMPPRQAARKRQDIQRPWWARL